MTPLLHAYAFPHHACLPNKRYNKLFRYTKVRLAKKFTLQSFSYTELEDATLKGWVRKWHFEAVNKEMRVELASNKMLRDQWRKLFWRSEGFKDEIDTVGYSSQKIGFCIEGSQNFLFMNTWTMCLTCRFSFKAAALPGLRVGIGAHFCLKFWNIKNTLPH